MRSYYFDSSAALKIIVTEAESLALRTWLADARPRLVACDLVRTEVLRACRRHSPESIARSRTVLDSLTLIAVSRELCMSAATLDPHGLRTLDAIHLAAALSLGDDVDGVVTYDDRLAAACSGYGLSVLAPA
jgi:predicted nucleic acid-binding protein